MSEIQIGHHKYASKKNGRDCTRAYVTWDEQAGTAELVYWKPVTLWYASVEAAIQEARDKLTILEEEAQPYAA